MDKSVGIKDVWEAFTKKQKSGGVLEQYQKKPLDTPLDPGYTDVTEGESQVVVAPVKAEIVEQKPAITIEQILATTEGTYPKAVVELAQIAKDMRKHYSELSSRFFATLMLSQDELGISETDLQKITGHIIKQKQVIIDNTQSAISTILKD